MASKETKILPDKIVADNGAVESFNNIMEPVNNIIEEQNDKIKFKNDNIEPNDEIMSLEQAEELINSVTDLVFLNTDKGIIFAPIYIDFMLAYWKIGFFYPYLGISEKGKESINFFFDGWVNGEYDVYLEKVKDNKQAAIIDKAIERAIEFKKSQCQQPVLNSLAKLVDTLSVLAQKYVDDIDNIGSSDIKSFLERFMAFTSENNVQTITDEVLNRHGAKLPLSDEKAKNAVAVQTYNELKQFLDKMPERKK